jgi:ribosomal protein L37AE/L43A
MGLKLIETYSQGEYTEIEVFQCSDCGRTFHIQSGGDIACCPCEFNEDF